MSAEPMDQLSPLQKAALAIKELRTRLNALEAARDEAIAIVGMDCRFPGADGWSAYWQLLAAGRDAISEVPPQRWDLAQYFDANANAPGKINTRHGGFLDRVDGFDAAFFGISPQEAEYMDPQQRLLLQLAWHALEDAGQPPAALRGSRTGVFVGITQNDYGMMQLAGPVQDIQAYTGTGNGFCFAAGRLAYALGAQGPTWAVDTACSSSLVALHQACQSLRSGECELALVAGVQLNLAPQMQVFLAKTQSFSPQGRCRSFDESANGFVLGEGIGVVVLRRLSVAQARRDAVRAVIRASAVNHGGPAGGLTVPNEAAQEALLREALARARLAPDDIDFIEAHGSATELGDPIEVGALRAVFAGRAADKPLLLGAVKTNFGHLSAAAGIAGLIKLVLMLEQERIAPNLHFEQPSSRIPWQGFAVRVPTAVEPWPRGQRPRRAGVSSFGLSGTNAHVVLEEAPLTVEPEATVAERPAHLLALSARSPGALRALAQAYLRLPPDIPLADLCYSANSGRSHFAQRLVLQVATPEQLRQGLSDFLAGTAPEGLGASRVAKGGPGRLAMLFGDTVDVDQVRALATSEASVAASLARCAAAGAPMAVPAAATLACQIALAELWIGWGLRPEAVAGSGKGGLAALYVAGVLDLQEAFRALAGHSVRGRAAAISVFSAVDGKRLSCLAGETQCLTAAAGIGAAALPALRGEGFTTQIGIHGRAELGASPEAEVLWLTLAAPPEAGLWPLLLQGLAALYRRGHAVDWAGFDAGRGRSRLRLPVYPFEEQRYWRETSASLPTRPLPDGNIEQAPADSLVGLLGKQLEAAGTAINEVVARQLAALKARADALPLDQAPAAAAPVDRLGDWRLLRLAAEDETALDALGQALASDVHQPLQGCHGSGCELRMLVHGGRDEAIAALGLGPAPRDVRRVISARAGGRPSLVFMFPGVGDHYLGMARGLYQHAAEFRVEVDRCCAFLQPLLGVDLREVIYPLAEAPAAHGKSAVAPGPAAAGPDLRAMLGRGKAAADPAEARLNQTAHSQPAVFVVEYALGRLWQARGVVPEAMIGYSIGEYAAACLAGVIEVEDALRLIARRAQLIETLPQGVLLTVPLAEAKLQSRLGADLSLALSCTPGMCVVGGTEAAVSRLEMSLRGEEIVSRRLPGSHAFHSHMLAPLHQSLVELVSGFRLRPPRIPYLSNLSGRWITAAEATDPVAWARHTWQTVRFAEGMAQLLTQEGRIFLEVGPGQSLGSFVLQHPAAQRLRDKLVLPSLRNRYERQPDEAFFLTTVGKLWLAGVNLEARGDNGERATQASAALS